MPVKDKIVFIVGNLRFITGSSFNKVPCFIVEGGAEVESHNYKLGLLIKQLHV